MINGFSSNFGLSLLAGGGAQAEVIDSTMRGNGDGIRVLPSSGMSQATIDHVRLEANFNGLNAREGSLVTVTNSVAANNTNVGLVADSFSSGPVQMIVDSTVASGNASDGILGQANGTGAVQVNVAGCVISGNSAGIHVQSLSTGVATVRVSRSTVTGNYNFGLKNDGGVALLLSLGDNTVEGNLNDTLGTIGYYGAK